MSARAVARAIAGLLITLTTVLPAGPAAGASPTAAPTAASTAAPSASTAPSAAPSAAASPMPSPFPRPSVLPPGVERPDIVVLLIDDLAQIDDRIWERMPTIRRLFLESGVRFTDAIGNDPLCCPGRANLLTGQWAEHHGVVSNNGRLFDPRVSIATELRSVGYWTGIFGKYFNQTPLIRRKWPPGWDRAFIFGGAYWNYLAWDNGRRETYRGADADYSATVIQDKVLDALRSAPPDRPRFVWLAPFAVHGGWNAARTEHTMQPWPAPQDVGSASCADLPRWSTAANFEFDMRDKPTFLQARRLTPTWDITRTCETMLSVDRLLAVTLDELRAQGRPDPLVILTADNGMNWGAHRWRGKFVPHSAPLPFFVRWPQVLGDVPASVPTTISNVDVAPTLCAIAGCRMGPFPNGHGVDGIDLLPLLLRVGAVNRDAAPGETRSLPNGVARGADGVISGLETGRQVVFTEHLTRKGSDGMPPWRGLWTTDESPIGRWVYTVYRTGEEELYDVSGGPCWTWRPGDPGDPCQLVNLAGEPDLADVQQVLAATLRGRERRPLTLDLPE